MSMETWGLAPKAQNDSQTIDEAIAAAIADHEADPQAHLGDGESLQSHKSEDVIDHPALSIVADKYDDNSLDPSKMYINTLDIHKIIPMDTYFDTYGYQDGTGGSGYFGEMGCEVDNRINSYFEAYLKQLWTSPLLGTKTYVWEVTIHWEEGDNFTVDATCNLPNRSYGHCGFKVANGTLYARHSNDTTDHTHSLGTIVKGRDYRLRFVSYPASHIEFYLDNELVYVADTYLPSDSDGDWHHYYKCKMTAANDDILFHWIMPYFAQYDELTV